VSEEILKLAELSVRLFVDRDGETELSGGQGLGVVCPRPLLRRGGGGLGVGGDVVVGRGRWSGVAWILRLG
jgi:hypothetical protein